MTVTRFAFKLGEGENYIDLAKAMSLVQRTMVRQKQLFTVLGGQLVDNPNTQSKIKISTAPNFWYIRAAINRCFKAWKDQRSRTLGNAELDGVKNATAKYADFKMSLTGSGSTLTPVYTGGASIVPFNTTGEWEFASVTDELGNERHFKIVGPHTSNYYSATKGWLVTRALPDAENEPDMMDTVDPSGAGSADGILDYKQDFINIMNETADGQPERLTLLYEDNDNAPFGVRDIYGNVDQSTNLQLQSLVYVNANNPSHMIAGFKALCGLIKVDVDENATDPILFLDVLNTPEVF